MADATILDGDSPVDQSQEPLVNVSKLPDQPEPPSPDTPKLPSSPDDLKPAGVSSEDPHNAVIRAPHDEDIYNELLKNATSDEDLLNILYGRAVVDAIKRLYAPDTTSPKAVAAAQNAIAVSELTGFKVSPAAYLENPDAYNEALFGTGHLREKIFMGLAGLIPSLVEGAPTGAAAEGVVDAAGAISAAWRAWRSGLWRLPLGIAGYEAEENANALIRSFFEGKPFSQTRPYGLHDVVPEQAGEGTKAVVDLLDMFGKSKAMHAGFEGLKTLWDAMAYDKVSQILPSQKLYIPATDIRSHFGAGTEGSAGDYYDILQKLNLSPGQIRDAAKYGLDVEVPLARVVGSMDAPWFAKLKNFLQITPGREVTEFTGGEPEARLHVSGELEAPAISAGSESGPHAESVTKPPLGTVIPETKTTPPETERPPATTLESEAPSQSVESQTFKNNDDYPQSPDFDQRKDRTGPREAEKTAGTSSVPHASAEKSEGSEDFSGFEAGDVQGAEAGTKKTSSLSPYKELEMALEAAGEPRPPGHEGHHIVALNDSRAELARQILKDFDVPINSADNGAWLPGTRDVGPAVYHRGLNTTKYHREVYERLRHATGREDVLEALRDIKEELSENKFPYLELK